MKKMGGSLLAFLSLFNLSEALLPPLYTTLAEYQTLLSNKELVKKLESGQAILSIERVQDGFVILTPKDVLRVDVVYEQQNHPGPAKFHLVFHDPVPREN